MFYKINTLYNELKEKYDFNNTKIKSIINNYDHNKELFLSKKLITFLHNTDYYVDDIIKYSDLFNKITYITNKINFLEINNTDDIIYNDLFNIFETDHLFKKALINRFINKYTYL